MPTVSGFTTFGIIRKRMADIYADFALRIKEGGVFGTQTTADLPDTFPTDPLVQIMTTTSASLHEVWEAVELWYSQLDPRTASGVYLEHMHGLRLGISRASGQTDDEYRAVLLAAVGRSTRTDIATVAAARPDIDCAQLVTSTVGVPIDGIPAPGNALVVKGCNIDYAALAADIYNQIDLGVHQFYGDIVVPHSTENGGCVAMTFMEARPLLAQVNVTGYYVGECVTTTEAAVRTFVRDRLSASFSSCGLGVGINAATAMLAIAAIPNFIVTGITFGRRARMLLGDGCTMDEPPLVTYCGEDIEWTTTEVCGFNAGEVWCAATEACVLVHPWEFLLFDERYLTVIEDATQGGCI
jgi:hypothetical protein